MTGVQRHQVSYHRIQDGKAIVSLSFVKGKLSEGGQHLEWVGDGYELLKELQEAITTLERKNAVKRGGVIGD